MAQAKKTAKRKTGATKKKASTKKTPTAKSKAKGTPAKKKAAGKSGGTRKVGDQVKLARLVEEAIDNGASTAEEIHRDIAALPLSVLESLNLKETAAGVRKVQDASIGAIYKLIHDITHHVTDLAVDLLEQKKTGGR